MDWLKRLSGTAKAEKPRATQTATGQSPLPPGSHLDVETVRRYIRSLRTVSGLAHSGPTGAQVLLSGAGVPLDTVLFPVIIPTEPIADIEQLMCADFRYFVIHGENLGLERGTMLFALDFDTPPTRTALSFLFTLAEHAEWLRTLVRLRRLGVNDGPDGSLLRAILLKFDAPLTPVEDWLASCDKQ